MVSNFQIHAELWPHLNNPQSIMDYVVGLANEIQRVHSRRTGEILGRDAFIKAFEGSLDRILVPLLGQLKPFVVAHLVYEKDLDELNFEMKWDPAKSRPLELTVH